MTHPPDSTSNTADRVNRSGAWLAAGEILLIVCLFFLASPQPPPGVNEPHYLCRLKHAVDPSYCAGDLFLESPDAHYTFVFCFAWLTRFLPLVAVAWLGRIAIWIGVAWAWRRLSWTVVPKPLYAVLGAGIVITAIAEGNFAGEWLVDGFEAKPIAYIFVLLGLRAWLLNNWNWAWIHLGIASAWHALAGGWSVVVLLSLWLLGYRRQQPLKSMLPGLVVGGSLSLLGVVPAITLQAGQPPEVRSEAAEIYVFQRLAHHLAPLHKSAEWIAERSGRHATVVTLLVGLAAVRVLDLRRQGKRLADDPALRVTQFAVGAMALAMVGLAIELALWNYPSQAAPWLRFYWFRLTDVASPLALAVLFAVVLQQLFETKPRWAVAALCVALALVGQFLTNQTLEHYNKPIARSDAKMKNPADWIAACEWVRVNTPRDALFLTPRHAQSFKWHASRGEVLTYKDIPQNASGLVEWRRRLYEVYKIDGDPNRRWSKTVEQLGTARVAELAQEFKFDYVISRRANPNSYALDFPVVYENDTYVVYSLRNHT